VGQVFVEAHADDVFRFAIEAGGLTGVAGLGALEAAGWFHG